MKRLIAVIILAVMTFSLNDCTSVPNTSQNSNKASQPENSFSVADSKDESEEAEANADTENKAVSKVLVAYFSRAGENYGVGVVEKGNTSIIADMIAEEISADTFEIARTTPYPEEYEACTDEAKEEQNENARPELTSAVDNFEDYDTIFIGYPIWWGDMPMAVYTFLESYDFSGKTVIPFCTHAGSGLSGTVQTLKDKLTGADVLDGLAISGTTAQNNQSEARKTVTDWLDGFDKQFR